LVRLTSGRFLKVKTCKNKEIYFAVLKPNERGLFRKTPGIDGTKVQVLKKLSNN
jgi:hypothetical protein